MPTKIAVLGAGSWGTALAMLIANNQHQVTLWGKDADQIKTMQQHHQNYKYLPNIILPESLQYTVDLTEAVDNAQQILIAVPSHAYQTFLPQLKPLLIKDRHIAYSSKGFCQGKLLHELLLDYLACDNATIISGPSFAKEVAQGLPTAVVVANKNQTLAMQWQNLLKDETFRPYISTDVVGVEVAGSVKNVLAIATGIADGLQLGSNAIAAIITRGLAEITRLGLAMGAQQETFMGLAGMGDLVLTCTDNQSRNRRFGYALGQGKTIAQAKQSIDQVIEGINTTQEAYQLAQRYDVDMPITEQIYQVLYHDLNIKQAVQNLLLRDLKRDSL
jgi:glycerol-3-phosphate dehydrogenase (NAD(P)+)